MVRPVSPTFVHLTKKCAICGGGLGHIAQAAVLPAFRHARLVETMGPL